MIKLSVIIPAYREPFLSKTIDSLLSSAVGEIEIIPIIDDLQTYQSIKPHPQVKPIFREKEKGMRGAFNAGLAKADGEYIMKLDAHSIVGPSFDKILTENCAENWLLIPRQYSLDETNWTINESKPFQDYYYISFPQQTSYGCGMWAARWPEMDRQRAQYDIDDEMTLPENCWFANKKYFMEHVGFMNEKLYGDFAGTQHEIGVKYWLGGGENKVIKKTWYAHLSKRPRHYSAGLFVRHYKIDRRTIEGHTWSAKHWINNEEPGMTRPFSWLIEKFWPVPGWPEDRRLWVLPK